MDPATILTMIGIVQASVDGVRKLIPIIRDAINNNPEIEQSELDSLRAAYDSLRSTAGPEFSGAGWELSGR